MGLIRVVLPVLILVAGAAGAVTLYKTRPASEPIKTEEKAWLIASTAIERGEFQPSLILYGRTETPRVARLAAAITANVVTVHVLEGERVEAGQVVATLDDRDGLLLLRQREAELAEVAAQVEVETQRHRNDQDALAREARVLELARRAVQRAQDLASTNVGSRSQLDQARQEEEQRSMAVEERRTAIAGHPSRLAQLRARLAKAEALRDRAMLDVDRTRVRAPFSGPVSSVTVAAGDRVQPGTVIMSVFDSAALELRAQIPSRYVPTVRQALDTGIPVAATATADARPIRAMLDRLGAQVSRGSGGVDALFRITDGAEHLPLGLTVEVLVALPPLRDVIALPTQALYGNDHVYRIEGDRLQRVDVSRVGELRSNGATRALVRSDGLRSGDRVVATQLPNAVEGLKVRTASG